MDAQFLVIPLWIVDLIVFIEYVGTVTAGTDTSRITLSITIGLVVEHPEIQKKLQNELDDVLGS